jgi:sulfite reductase beta subunit-like hemoprotein
VTALVALARLDAPTLAGLAQLAHDHETTVRLSPRRTLTLVDLDRAVVAPVQQRLAALGLVTGAASGWIGLTACAGLGHCARARLDVRAAAAARAAVRRAGDEPEHWVACERRCGARRGQRVRGTVA